MLRYSTRVQYPHVQAPAVAPKHLPESNSDLVSNREYGLLDSPCGRGHSMLPSATADQTP